MRLTPALPCSSSSGSLGGPFISFPRFPLVLPHQHHTRLTLPEHTGCALSPVPCHLCLALPQSSPPVLSRVQLSPVSVSHPQVGERPVALEAEVALTLKVLETMADSSLGSILDQPLHTLRHIQSELQACVSARGTWVLSAL